MALAVWGSSWFLCRRLVGALRSLHIERPTAIQAACIGPALAGRDVIGCGETGAGKTLAFGLPIVQGLSEDLFGVAALILTPSRELAVQVRRGREMGTKS
jgi:ATP-dependent RNA helicase DDX49/DBP8